MRFQISRGNMGNINIVIMFFRISTRKRLKFRFETFFWELSLNDAGSSFQILAPTLEKTLFWKSSLDFLI